MLRFTARSASSGPRHLRAIRLSESAATSAGSQTLLPTAIVASVSSAHYSACWAPARTFRGARRGVHPSVPRRTFASWRPPPHDAAQLVRWLKEADAPLWDDAKERGTYELKTFTTHNLGPTRDRDEALTRAKAYVSHDPEPRMPDGDAPYSIVATWGSPGTGKSHILDDILAQADGWVRETGHADRCLPLVANFNGKANFKLKKHGLVVRLLLSYFCRPLSRREFKKYGEALLAHMPPEIDVALTVEAIMEDFASVHDLPVERVKVMMLVDEIASSEDATATYAGTVDAVDSLWPRVGAVFTALERAKLITEFGASSSIGSKREIWWLPLNVLNTFAWCDSMNISDKYHRQLFALTAGHARTMDKLLHFIQTQREKVKCAERDAERVTDQLLDHFKQLADHVMTVGSNAARDFLFPALIGQELDLRRGSDPTKFGEAVRDGVLLNADFGDNALEKEIPLVSLFGWFVYAHKKKMVTQQHLLSELFKERDGPVFERLFALHLSVLFELFSIEGPRIQLFDSTNSTKLAGKALFRGAKFIHTPNLAVEELRLKCKTGRIMAVEEDLWRMPASGLTVSTTEILVPSPYENIPELLPFDIIYSRAESSWVRLVCVGERRRLPAAPAVV